MIADPRAVAERWPEPRQRAIAELATAVALAPWTARRPRELSDDEILHVVALSAFFGHLNRIADAVAAPLDYEVRHLPPQAEPSTPMLLAAPARVPGEPAIALARRPATADALASWRSYVFERDEPLTRRQRAVIAAHVAESLGDRDHEDDGLEPRGDLEGGLVELAVVVTRAPWWLVDEPHKSWDGLGLSDAALFDAVATASTAGVASRITVALTAIGQ